MINLTLSPEEALILHRILASYDSELHMELAGTGVEGLGDVLKREEEFIHHIVERLEEAGLSLPQMLTGDYD